MICIWKEEHGKICGKLGDMGMIRGGSYCNPHLRLILEKGITTGTPSSGGVQEIGKSNPRSRNARS